MLSQVPKCEAPGAPRFSGCDAFSRHLGHPAIDDHSRVAFTRLLPDQKAETTIGFLRAATSFFAQRNVPIRALLTDNGSAYRSHLFRDACAQMQLKHRRTRPYTPRTNGKAERFIQTVLSEWAYPGTYQNFAGHRARSTQGSTATTSTDSMLASTTIPQPHAQSLIRTTY